MRRRFCYVNPDNSLTEELSKFQWLHAEHVISDEELQSYVDQARVLWSRRPGQDEVSLN